MFYSHLWLREQMKYLLYVVVLLPFTEKTYPESVDCFCCWRYLYNVRLRMFVIC